MEYSVDEFLEQYKEKISPKLRALIERDYATLRVRFGFKLANDTLAKHILANKYGSVIDHGLAIALKKWVNKKLEDYYSASKPVTHESTVHCCIGNTEVL